MADSRVRELSFSSEKAVERWFGNEILDHSPGSVRMGFMQSGRAPLLLNHDMRQQVGIVESASLEKKRGIAGVRFGRKAAANDALQDVDDGILVNTSVGYRVLELRLDSSKGDVDTYRVIDWEPFEASLVPVPADDSVGVGRSASVEPDPHPPDEPAPQQVEPEAREVRASSVSETTTAKPATGVIMTTENRGAGEGAEKINAVDAERERREAIIALCAANKIDSRVEARWIMDGTPLQGKDSVATQILAVVEERGKAKPTEASELGLSRNETNRYSMIRVIRALKFPTNQNLEAAAFELECSRGVAQKLNRGDTGSIFVPGEVLVRPVDAATMQRAMATTPGAKGGYMVNVTNMGFIDILRNRSVVMNMGARQLSGLVGNVTFARQTGKQSVTWQAGEGTSVTAGDQALGQLSMTPKTAICVTDVSEQLLRQASPSAEQFIMADLAAVIAIDGVDNAAINGTGGAQPLGIKNTTGITSGQSASTFSYAKALAFPVAAGAVNAIRGNPGWVTNIAGASIAMQRQRFTSTDSPLWEGNLLDGNLVGFRAMSSEQLASANIIFGSWDELVIGDWGVLELATDNGGTRFNTAQVGIRAMWMVDTLLRYPQAFVVGTDLS